LLLGLTRSVAGAGQARIDAAVLRARSHLPQLLLSVSVLGVYQAAGTHAQALALPAHDEPDGGQASGVEFVALEFLGNLHWAAR